MTATQALGSPPRPEEPPFTSPFPSPRYGCLPRSRRGPAPFLFLPPPPFRRLCCSGRPGSIKRRAERGRAAQRIEYFSRVHLSHSLSPYLHSSSLISFTHSFFLSHPSFPELRCLCLLLVILLPSNSVCLTILSLVTPCLHYERIKDGQVLRTNSLDTY